MSRAQRSIVVVGSSNTDMTVAAKSLPVPGETLTGGAFYTAAGGKGANQAVAAARLAGPCTRVALVAAVGDDDLGRAAVEGFRAEGIDVRHVRTIAGTASGVALILVGARGENMIVVAPGANAGLRPTDAAAARKLIKGADVLLAQLETPLATVTRAVSLAAGAGVLTILNPAPAPARPLPATLLEKIGILTPNETEFEALTGASLESARGAAAARKLAAVLGVALLVTEGRKGVRVLTRRGESYRVRAFPAKAVDTVAAGDAFSGALALAMAEGRELREAIRFAAAAAAISVTRRGAQPGMPRRAEVLARLKRAPLLA